MQVDPLGGGFRGDHDLGPVPEVLHQRRPRIRRAGAGHPVRTLVPPLPLGIDFPRSLVAVGAIEQHNILGVTMLRQQIDQIVLGAPGLGENHRLLRPAQFGRHAKTNLQSLQQRCPLCVLANLHGQLEKRP